MVDNETIREAEETLEQLRGDYCASVARWSEYTHGEGNIMTVDFLMTIVMCALAPACMLAFICIVERQKRHKDDSTEAKKNYYSLKTAGSNKRLEEKNCFTGNGFIVSFYVVLIIFFVFVFLVILDIYQFELLKSLCSIGNCISVVGLTISILVVISLILTLKKEIYLGISTRDVMKQSRIPDNLTYVFVGSVFMLGGYILYDLSVIKSDSDRILLVKLWIGASFVYVLANLMIIIYRTVKLCLNIDRKELSVFRCFRYKIVNNFQVDDLETKNANVIEGIAAHLLREIIRNFSGFIWNADHLRGVELYSIVSDKQDKKCLQCLRRYANGFMLIVELSIMGTGVLTALMLRPDWWIHIVVIAILAFISLFVYGCYKDTWLIVFNARYYYVFDFANPKSRKTQRKIAARSNNLVWDKRFRFVGSVEDLLGFYKILLYNKRGKKNRYLLIEQVVSTFEEKNAKIRNAVLLLLYYLEYEKIYLKLEQKRKTQRDKSDLSDEAFVRLVDSEVKKKKVINYNQLKEYMDFENVTSVEYQLAYSILSHVYKEPEKDGNTIVPEKLRNYKFESFYNHVCTQAKYKSIMENQEHIANVEESYEDVSKKNSGQTIKDNTLESHDYCFSVAQTEYEHGVSRAAKLDNKVYILLTVCAFIFSALNGFIMKISRIAPVQEEWPDYQKIVQIYYEKVVVLATGSFLIALILLVILLMNIKFYRIDSQLTLEKDLFAKSGKTCSKFLCAKYIQAINKNMNKLDLRYKFFNISVIAMIFTIVCLIILSYMSNFMVFVE